MEGHFNQGKGVNEEMHKVYLETPEVEDLFRGMQDKSKKPV